MPKIELSPTLSQCIETLAKKEYDTVARQLLASGKENSKQLEIAALLKNFLETADFKRLRAESERHLMKGKNVKFMVYWRNGVTKCEMRLS